MPSVTRVTPGEAHLPTSAFLPCMHHVQSTVETHITGSQKTTCHGFKEFSRNSVMPKFLAS